MPHPPRETVLVLDFGAQYAQLIARRIREAGVYSEIVPNDVTPEQVRAKGARGLVLSGGPASVFEPGAPSMDRALLELGLPVLGICYGLQLVASLLGEKVEPAPVREFGRTAVRLDRNADLFRGLPAEIAAWMSHGDHVSALSGGAFEAVASTANAPQAAVRHRSRPIWGVQFHPEVTHTERGTDVLRNFLARVCGCTCDWRMGSFAEEAVARVRERVGAAEVVCGLSGGVDSAVTAAIVHRAAPGRVHCILIDTGLLRAGEAVEVRGAFREAFPDLDLRVIDASDRFFARLAGVTDPEEKRRRIGHLFIAEFREAARALPKATRFLAQGTLYPDVIESRSPRGGPSATIKTHHNVGGLPAELGFELCEPLRELFKDEVRALGRALGLPDAFVKRQPFPGPGLAVRVLGEVTRERVALLREADRIAREELQRSPVADAIWQSFAALLPLKTVGVMGDRRTYEDVIAIRAVTSEDGMTADWARVPHETLARISTRITNEVRGVNRVVYDISSKPPSTIEWE